MGASSSRRSKMACMPSTDARPWGKCCRALYRRCSNPDRPQEREAPALTVDGILAGRERHIATRAGPALPDREADQFETVERACTEVQLRVGKFSRRVATVVHRDLDGQVCGGRCCRSHSVLLGTVMCGSFAPRGTHHDGRKDVRTGRGGKAAGL